MIGVPEHSTGTEGVMSMSNMAMMVGKLGREGCGVNPLRGQNNVQGACDMGAQPNVYPGYPMRFIRSIIISVSSLISPGTVTALRTLCTRRSVLVNVPSFSA